MCNNNVIKVNIKISSKFIKISKKKYLHAHNVLIQCEYMEDEVYLWSIYE